MAGSGERRITHVRDVFAASNGGCAVGVGEHDADVGGGRARNVTPTCGDVGAKKYKTLERHLSMKKTIRKKMMRDLRDIGDVEDCDSSTAHNGFLDKLKTDQPPSANVDKPSLWKRLTKGWSGSSSKT